jgi:hypothetical protein
LLVDDVGVLLGFLNELDELLLDLNFLGSEDLDVAGGSFLDHNRVGLFLLGVLLKSGELES